MNFIEKTGITFASGQPLTAAKLNILNDRINLLVDAANNFMKGVYDVNLEQNAPDARYTLSEAIHIVSGSRRWRGLKIRFQSNSYRYLEYSFNGPTVNDEDWNNTGNWVNTTETVDGGEW